MSVIFNRANSRATRHELILELQEVEEVEPAFAMSVKLERSNSQIPTGASGTAMASVGAMRLIL